MKLLLCTLVTLFTVQAFAADLSCVTFKDSNDGYTPPKVAVYGKVAGSYKVGVSELQGLEVLVIKSAAGTKVMQNVPRDYSYRPRTFQNRVRINFPAIVLSNADFDGVLHSVILPKVLDRSTAVRRNDQLEFYGILASSTDSYHDGIISYFKLQCVLK